ncbi:hypothetical protein Tco_0642908 [Tanacetum coccineum]
MATLESCPKHNMVAYFEKTDGNADFLMSAKSKTINNVRYINAKVAGKPVTILEASIRSDLLFDDADGIDGKHFSGKVTPLFLTMLVQLIEDEGEEGSGGNHGAQDTKIKTLKAQIKQLKKKARLVINHHKAWFRAVRLKTQQKSMDNSQKRRSISKQGRKAVKSFKDAPSVTTHPNWDGLEETLDEAMDYTLAQDEGKTDKVDEKGESTTHQQSTDRQKEGIDKPKVSTARAKVSTDIVDEGTAEPEDNEPKESTTLVAQTTTPTTSTPTPTTFGDDETIAQVLLNMSQAKAVLKEKEKGVELKDVEDSERPRPTSTRSLLTLKPLPKIDPKDKGKKKIEEDDEWLQKYKRNVKLKKKRKGWLRKKQPRLHSPMNGGGGGGGGVLLSGPDIDKIWRVRVYGTDVICYQIARLNVTRPDTTSLDLRKRHPYTPYKDPQGFIYVDDFERNRLMRTAELYKFSDGTLNRLLTSLNDITNNINMEYLPKKRWSNLKNKRAHYMIKDINKLLKERRMMRSLERFVGGRLYGTGPRLLQRTI